MSPGYQPSCRQLHFDSWPHDQPLAHLRFATDIPRGQVRWLWPQRLPIGRIALLVGDPGVGKSLLLADIAARHSAGRPLPPLLVREPLVRESPPAPPPPGGVLFVSPEDGHSATLQPRLVAAGAALENILTIDGVRADKYAQRADLPFTLPQHFDLLEDAIQPVPAPRLVVLDPLTALLSSELRPAALITVLRRLSLFAARNEAAVVAVAHLVKTSALHVLYRVRGSLTLSAAARAALLVSPDPLHPDRRILSVIKSVYAAPPPPLAFDILPPDPRADHGAPRIEWQAPPPDALSASSLRCPLLANSPEAHSALHDACAWLLDFLAAGPRDVHALHSAAARDGHSPTTLRRAKRLLSLQSRKPDQDSPWQWSLP